MSYAYVTEQTNAMLYLLSLSQASRVTGRLFGLFQTKLNTQLTMLAVLHLKKNKAQLPFTVLYLKQYAIFIFKCSYFTSSLPIPVASHYLSSHRSRVDKLRCGTGRKISQVQATNI